MAVYRVIISHLQSDSLVAFPSDENTVVVLDAPTESDLDICARNGFRIRVMMSAGNRSSNRNAGFQRISDLYYPSDTDIVEFFDGDRYPVRYDPSVMDILRDGRADCLLYACESDMRRVRYGIKGNPVSLVDTGTLCNPFYSCGFAMTVSAIRRVADYNGGNFFEPRFDRWGCEDQYLGLVCSVLGFRVAFTDRIVLHGDVGGDSFRHPDYRRALQTYVDLVRERDIPVRCEPTPSVAL